MTTIHMGKNNPFKLSEKELDVLRWIANGKHYEEISAILSVSVLVVTQRIHVIKNKLGANTTAGAVAIALRKGVIE